MKYETRTAVVIVLLFSLFFLTSLCKRRTKIVAPITSLCAEYDDIYEVYENYDGDETDSESDLEFYCVVYEPGLQKEQDESIS